MSRLTIRRITLALACMLGVALAGFSALFVQVNAAVAHARTGAAPVPVVSMHREQVAAVNSAAPQNRPVRTVGRAYLSAEVLAVPYRSSSS